MVQPDDAVVRLASAAERIADALEYMVRTAAASGPQPHLAVARSPTDRSRLAPVNLTLDGTLFATVQNIGDAATTLIEPTVHIGDERISGGIVDRNSRPQPSALVPASSDGPGVVVRFDLGRQAHQMTDVPLTLRLPHRPGRFPGDTVLEVQMEPAGSSDGRHGWRQVNAQERPGAYGAA